MSPKEAEALDKTLIDATKKISRNEANSVKLVNWYQRVLVKIFGSLDDDWTDVRIMLKKR